MIVAFSFSVLNFLSAQQISEDMVLISAGEFMMGNDAKPEADYYPAHKVNVDSFYMDIHEVTNAEYYAFCQATDHKLPEFWGIDKYRSGMEYPDCPVLGGSQVDAKKYAEYVRKRLPTEAEWEYAARGGLEGKKYSNGDDFKECIILDSVFVDSVRHPYPVLAGNPNAFGLYGMSCNAREWVNDKYGIGYYKISPIENPQGPETGRLTVVRGGGWKSGTGCKSVYIRNTVRHTWVDIAVGFRCVMDVE